MLTPLTERQQKLIVSNVVKACGDITKLSKVGYDFLYLASGFIAHYNRYGFMHYYSEPGSLAEDILRHRGSNQWHNFRPGEENYEYYMAKKNVYNAIVDGIRKVYGEQLTLV